MDLENNQGFSMPGIFAASLRHGLYLWSGSVGSWLADCSFTLS